MPEGGAPTIDRSSARRQSQAGRPAELEAEGIDGTSSVQTADLSNAEMFGVEVSFFLHL